MSLHPLRLIRARLLRPAIRHASFQPLISRQAPSSSSPLQSIIRLQRTPQQSCPFSSTRVVMKRRRKGGPKTDARITQIRYFLHHPKTPRPLRFSRLRALRHWTIHKAWLVFQRKVRIDRELELQRQYQSMRDACEALRLTGENGLAITEPGNATPPIGARDRKTVEVEVERVDANGKKSKEKVQLDIAAAAEQQKEVGRLYRIAMEKKGVWQGFPLEYARFQTDTPPRDGWDSSWRRA